MKKIKTHFWLWYYKRVHKVNFVQLMGLHRLLQSRRDYFNYPEDHFMRKNFEAPLTGVDIDKLQRILDKAFRRIRQ